MKGEIITIAVTLLMVLILPTSSLYADYESMQDEVLTYIPPHSFTILSDPETRETEPDMGETGWENSDFVHLRTLKRAYETTVSDTDARLGMTGSDKESINRIFPMVADNGALKNQVQNSIVLDEIKIMALLRNPAILAAQKKVVGEIQLFDQVMDLDDTLRQYTAFTSALNNKAGPLRSKDSIKMNYPLPGLTALKGRIIQNQVAGEINKRDIVVKQVVADVETAYWDLVFVEQTTRITEETLAAFDRLKDVATTLYKSGRTSFQDLMKINIKMEEYKEELITLVSHRRNIEIRLLELLNLPPDIPLGRIVPAPLPPRISGPEPLYPIAVKYRQELWVIRHQILKLEAMVEMAESMTEAQFTLGLSGSDNEIVNTAGSDAPNQAFATRTMAAMKNNSPVKPWYGADEPWLNQMRQNLSGLRQVLVNQENATHRMVHNAWFKVDRIFREYRLYKDRILPLAKSALDVSTREYETGAIPFSQAIDSYTGWLKVKLTIAEKQTGLGSAFADLEQIMGTKYPGENRGNNDK
ncbi:MAG: TolC family protein [Desulfobacterium sp.]|nr:TolC family protein [Desulfobacterium sp.]